MGNNILTKELLLKSVEEWNAARKAYREAWGHKRSLDFNREVNLSGADLRTTDLRGADLSDANLCDANLSGANLFGADLRGAQIVDANLSDAELCDANLNATNLSGANLINADLSFVTIIESNLSGSNLSRVDLSSANIKMANFNKARLYDVNVGDTVFGDIDLSSAIGLETIRHSGPSTIGIDTLFASKGNIPEVFLRGCGVPDSFIEYARSLTAKAFDYYSCFISHSTADKDFADRLYADLQAKGVRCWYAPHDMEGGEHIDTQIDRAIKVHEKLLLVLSESSINSNWVKREISKAVNREDKEGKRVLFPISLVEFSKIEEWEFVDSKGRDLSEEIRKFSIPSFKGWEHDNAIYTTEFPKLLKAFQEKSKL